MRLLKLASVLTNAVDMTRLAKAAGSSVPPCAVEEQTGQAGHLACGTTGRSGVSGTTLARLHFSLRPTYLGS